jgi:two-component system, sensor histidine kinase RegB
MPLIEPTFLRTLCSLRWLTVLGESVTVALALFALRLPLPVVPMCAGIAALALFNIWASRRALHIARPAVSEAFAHIAVDVASLTWMVGFSGGIMNPFISLFLLPTALAALALPIAWVLATAAICCLGYALAVIFGQPLPQIHGVFGDAFDLHLWGMTVNFAFSIGVVLYFLSRLAAALRERERELARLREQFARNEGIVALATHAASVAHELNTPLGTLTLLLEDLRQDASADDPLRKEIDFMAMLVDQCRDRVRALAAEGDPDTRALRSLRAYLDEVIERWLLVRPAIQLVRDERIDAGRQIRLDPAIGHLLQALLNNAADASERNRSKRVDLHLQTIGDSLRGEIRDYGHGLDGDQPFLPGTLFRTSKPHGLGVGLALSHATVERLGGSLSLESADGGGVCTRFDLPLPASED